MDTGAIVNCSLRLLREMKSCVLFVLIAANAVQMVVSLSIRTHNNHVLNADLS